MLRVLFVTGATHRPWMVNMNHFQRVYFLSRQCKLTVFGGKNACFHASANENTEIIRAPWPGKIGIILFYLLQLVRDGRNWRYDIVLTEPSKLCLCGFLARLWLGLRWVVDVWDIPFRCKSGKLVQKWRTKVDRSIARRLFKYADLFILSILPDLEFRQFDVPRDRMLLLKNAIWPNARPSRQYARGRGGFGSFKILCMRSRFATDGGLDVLAEAFALLSESHDNIELTIVGKIPRVVEPQVARLRQRCDVAFKDFVEHDELLRLIAASTVCVVPFRNTPDLSQTFPIKVLEYLSVGAVVVAADLPGIASMVRHGYNGLLFRPGDAADLADKLRTIAVDRDLAATVSSRATTTCNEHDCRNKAEVILSALKKLVG